MFLKALKSIPAWQRDAEAALAKKLQGLFGDVFAKTLQQLEAAGRIPSNDAARRAIIAGILELRDPFGDTVAGDAIGAAQHGRNKVIVELNKRGAGLSLSEFSKQANDIIRNHVFEASQRTLARMAGDVMANLSSSYEQGLGIGEAAESLRSVFTRMEDYELERVARTEIQSFQNQGAYMTEVELGVEFHQWWSADDERVRGNEPTDSADHVLMHGQIVRVGEPFSNGLYYPGDRSGGADTIGEWINCRCREIPFLMPEGSHAPYGVNYFYAQDIIAA